jgi:ABC-2 type transport system ATP-binding protein
MSTVIETLALTKTYGKHQAVCGINLSVQVGSVCAFLGQNGAGKSSTIKMLLGMIHPTSGSGSIFGHRIDKESESLLIRQKVAFVAEDKRLYDYMTVGQIVHFTKSFFPRWDHALESRLLEQFELPLERKIRQLSKGMRTKLALLLGFARGCELLVLDEPTEGLDPVAIEDVLQIVVSLAAQGTTIFFSSHQIAEVEQVADYVLMIDRGKLVLDAPMDRVKEQYAFGASMTGAGIVVVTFGLFLAETFEGEFTSPVVGLCTLTATFLGYRAHILKGWNVFEVMSATTSIDPNTQLITGEFHWLGITVCFLASAVLLGATIAVLQARDF